MNSKIYVDTGVTNMKIKQINKIGTIAMALVVVMIAIVSIPGSVAQTSPLTPVDDTPDISDYEVQMISNFIPEYKLSASQISNVQIIPGGKYTATILMEESSNLDKSEMSFYYPGDHPNGCGALFEMFNGPDKVGSSKTFDTRDQDPQTSDDFGISFNEPVSWSRSIGGLYFSEKRLNTDNIPHIIVAKVNISNLGTNYFIMAEGWYEGGDEDYNEMIVRLTPPSSGSEPDVRDERLITD